MTETFFKTVLIGERANLNAVMEMIQKLKRNDNYTTPFEVWDNIKEYLPTDGKQVVWESFYNEGSHSVDHLRALGCQVVYGNVDFYTTDMGDVIITNPPFSEKERVFARLAELDKPFIVTIPIHSLATRFIKRLFKNQLQIIIPDLRLHFEFEDKFSGVRKTVKRTPFDTIYACYKMNLPRDCLWL